MTLEMVGTSTRRPRQRRAHAAVRQERGRSCDASRQRRGLGVRRSALGETDLVNDGRRLRQPVDALACAGGRARLRHGPDVRVCVQERGERVGSPPRREQGRVGRPGP
jgi:hypothetical protein